MVDGREGGKDSPKNECEDARDLPSHTPWCRGHHRHSPVPSIPRSSSRLNEQNSRHLIRSKAFMKSYRALDWVAISPVNMGDPPPAYSEEGENVLSIYIFGLQFRLSETGLSIYRVA